MIVLKWIRYVIYLLQLENYHLPRYVRVVLKKGSNIPDTLRFGLTWTSKMKLVTALATSLLLLAVLTSVLLVLPSLGAAVIVGFMVLVAGIVLFPLFLVVGVVMVLPVDRFARYRITSQAQEKRRSFPGLQVIGITGSYGKTTMRDMVAAAIGAGKKVLVTKENFNTPLGISRQIISELDETYDVYVVEMGAYTRGDIRELVELVDPTHVVLTGINEAHLDRQKTLENIILTKFEIVTYARDDAHVFLNAEDERVRENAVRFLKESNQVVWYGIGKKDISQKYVFSDEPALKDVKREFEVHGLGDVLQVKLNFLPRYAAGTAAAALAVASDLGVRLGAAKQALQHMMPPERRLYPQEVDGVLIIDDSYNGNPDGAREAIRLLGEFKDRRTIYVTAGLIEMGEATERIHKGIGRRLAENVKEVVLVQSEGAPFIREGLIEGGFLEDHIHTCATTLEAQALVRSMVKPGDVVLFRNDVPESHV